LPAPRILRASAQAIFVTTLVSVGAITIAAIIRGLVNARAVIGAITIITIPLVLMLAVMIALSVMIPIMVVVVISAVMMSPSP